MFYSFTIPGRPITKKNSMEIITNRRTGKPMPIQSKQYRAYEEACLWHLRRYKVRFTGPVHVKALYWMPNEKSWPDLLGVEQATGDILQKAGVIDNDKHIVSWDGSRIVGVDKDDPRVEIEIREATE